MGSSQAFTKWKVKVARKLRVAHKVIADLESELKLAQVEKRGAERGGGRKRKRLAKIKHQLKGLRSDEALLMQGVRSTAREARRETKVAQILRKRSVQVRRVVMAVRQIVEEGRAKLANGLRSEHERAVESLEKGAKDSHWLSLEKEKWEILSRDITLMRNKLKKEMQHQHNVLMNIVNQVRSEHLKKSEIIRDLTKLGVEFEMTHRKLLKIRKLGERQVGVQHNEGKEKELLSVLSKETEWRKRLMLRMSKVRMKEKEVVKKLFVLRHAQSQLRRFLARVGKAVVSRARGLSKSSSKLNLWSYRRRKSGQKLLHERNKLVSELSRRNHMSRKLRKLVAQRIREARLSRKLRISSAMHAKELLSGEWERRRTELNIARGRRLASNVAKKHLTWSNMFRDLQRIKSVVATLTKRVHKESGGYVQAKKRHAGWRRTKRARYTETRLMRAFNRKGILNHRLNRARSEFHIQYDRSMMLFKKMQKSIGYIVHEIKSLRVLVRHLHNEIRASEGRTMVNREMLKVGKTLSAKIAWGRKLSARVKRTRRVLMKTMMKAAKTISELKRLRKMEGKVTLRVGQGRLEHMGKARMERFMKKWTKRRAYLALMLEREKIAMGRGIEHLEVDVARQKKELDDIYHRQRKFVQRLQRRERRVMWAHKVSEKQAKRLRWKLALIREEVKRVEVALKGVHGTQSKHKRDLEKVRMHDRHLHKELHTILEEVRKVRHKFAVERVNMRAAIRVVHLRMSHDEMQLRRGRQGQYHAHELLQLAEAQLRQAHQSMNKLVSTYKKLRVQPRWLQRVHALEEKEREGFHKIKHIREKRLNVEAKIRLIQRKLLEKSGK